MTSVAGKLVQYVAEELELSTATQEKLELYLSHAVEEHSSSLLSALRSVTPQALSENGVRIGVASMVSSYLFVLAQAIEDSFEDMNLEDDALPSSISRAVFESVVHFAATRTCLDEGVLIIRSNGDMLESNKRAEEILGLTRSQLYGKSLYDPKWGTLREDGSPFPASDYPATQTLLTGRAFKDAQFAVREGNGHLRWISVNSYPIYYGLSSPLLSASGETQENVEENNPPDAVVACFQDRSREKRATRKLKGERQFLHSTLDALSEAVITINSSGRIVNCNKRFAEMMGIPSENLQNVDDNGKRVSVVRRTLRISHRTLSVSFPPEEECQEEIPFSSHFHSVSRSDGFLHSPSSQSYFLHRFSQEKLPSSSEHDVIDEDQHENARVEESSSPNSHDRQLYSTSESDNDLLDMKSRSTSDSSHSSSYYDFSRSDMPFLCSHFQRPSGDWYSYNQFVFPSHDTIPMMPPSSSSIDGGTVSDSNDESCSDGTVPVSTSEPASKSPVNPMLSVSLSGASNVEVGSNYSLFSDLIQAALSDGHLPQVPVAFSFYPCVQPANIAQFGDPSAIESELGSQTLPMKDEKQHNEDSTSTRSVCQAGAPSSTDNANAASLQTSLEAIPVLVSLRVVKKQVLRSHLQVVIIIRDIKAEIESERNIISAQAKSAFLARMSHEIRTPLNGIILETETLLEEAQGKNSSAPLSKSIESLEIINESAEHLLLLVNDVLDAERYHSSTFELELAPMCIPDVVHAAERILSKKAFKKNQIFEVLIEDEHFLHDGNVVVTRPDLDDTESLNSPIVLGDPLRLRQILLNMLDNAFRFTSDSGRITLRVHYVSSEEYRESRKNADATIDGSEDDTLFVRFSIEDTGIGIAEDRLEKIFNAFEQVSSGTTRLFGGSGLGLTICRRLVDLMNGTISLKSVVNRGSTFSFVLPFRRIPENADNSEAIEAVRDIKRLCSPRKSSSKQTDKSFVLPTSSKYFKEAISSSGCILHPSLQSCIGSLSQSGIFCRIHRFLNSRSLFSFDSSSSDRAPSSSQLAEHSCPAVGNVETPPRSSSVSPGLNDDMNIQTRRPSIVIREVTEKEKISVKELKILVVEDNVLNRKVILNLLKHIVPSAEVEFAQDAFEALHLLRFGAIIPPISVLGTEEASAFLQIGDWIGRYHLLLIDYHMPNMDGIELTRLLRQHHSMFRMPSPQNLFDPAIVLCTADVLIATQELAFQAGCDAVVHKPVRRDFLLSLITTFFSPQPAIMDDPTA